MVSMTECFIYLIVAVSLPFTGKPIPIGIGRFPGLTKGEIIAKKFKN